MVWFQNLVFVPRIIFAFGCLTVFLKNQDVTSITNRGFYHGVLQVPTIINMFCTSLAADGLLYTGEYPGQWRWGYGMIPIIMAVCVLPIIVGLWIPQIKFERAGMYQAYLDERKRVLGGRTWWESLSFFATELDAVSCVLLVGGLCMILLPFQLESTWGSWASCKFNNKCKSILI